MYPEVKIFDPSHPLAHPTRLAILLSVMPKGRIVFSVLQKMLDLTPGNLDSHLRKLESVGYVKVKKHFTQYGIRTVVSITEEGYYSSMLYISKLKRTLAEVIREESFVKQPEIEELLLLYKDGRLIHHISRSLKLLDREVLSSMLIAVKEFIKDSLPEEKEDIVEFRYGVKRYVMFRHEHLVLAIGCSARDKGENLKELFSDLLKTIAKKYPYKKWNGRASMFEGVGNVIKEYLSTKLGL